MTGTVLDYAGTVAPDGWMLCYGQSLLRSDYPDLFARIGTAFGAADANHFSLPDYRGRVAAGKDDMGGTAAGRVTAAGAGINGAQLGATGGTETHALTTAQMPNHSHANTLSDPGHAHANSISDPGHSHSFAAGQAWTNGGPQTWGGGPAGAIGVQPMNAAATGIWINNAGAATGMGINNAAAGSGTAHPNVQPTLVLNKIIKT